jgi:hypothetical protein
MNGVNLKIWLAITVFLSGMVGTSFGYKIIYVDDNAKGANNGSSWENAYNFLQDALADASSSAKPVEIRVAQGIYKPDQGTGITPGGRTAAFQLINGVTIKGGYAGPRMSLSGADPNAQDIALYETILSGDIGAPSDANDNCYHIFYHPEGLNLDDTAILDGFTITGGNANGSWPHYYGGGMDNEYYSSPTINNCTFNGNSAGAGGGMENYQSSPTVTNCTFSGNSADFGGGMDNEYYSSPTINNCTFNSNSAGAGGGMENYKSSPNVTNCTFSGNSANDGGGMSNYEDSNPIVEDCTFSANSAKYYSGGGMFNEVSSPTMVGCIFSGNTANHQGGGMYNYNYSSPTVNNCTFSRNSAYAGGGMDNESNCSPNVNNCTFSNNSAKYRGGGIDNFYSSAIAEGCTFIGNSANYGGGMYNRGSDPMIEDCTFNVNSANFLGGGMYNYEYSSPTLTNCTFNGNSAKGGGGMFNYVRSRPTVKGCAFSGNSASISGGGMFNYWQSSPTLTNCTIADNNAPNGPAMACDSYLQKYPSTVKMVNCIIWNGFSWLWNYDNSTITIAYGDVEGSWPGEGNMDADPCFVEMGYWDPNGTPADANDDFWVEGNYHLQPDSPCINAGDPNFIAEPNETDIDGEARVMFEWIDMGADEFNPIRLGIVSKTRVARTEFAYDCNATFTNLWPFAVKNVELQMMQAPENMTIIEPNVTFGDIEFGTRESITSIDTCTFQVDRSKAIEPDKIVWKVKCQMADTGTPIELTCAGDLADEGKIGFEDLAELAGQWLKADGDGVVNFIDFARIAEKWQGQ